MDWKTVHIGIHIGVHIGVHIGGLENGSGPWSIVNHDGLTDREKNDFMTG